MSGWLSAPDNVKIGALAFLFDTFGEDHSPADVRLTLYKDGHELFSVMVDKKKITDNKWVFFEFPERMKFTTGVYSASLSLPGYTGPRRLTAWTVQGGSRDACRYRRKDPGAGCGRGSRF